VSAAASQKEVPVFAFARRRTTAFAEAGVVALIVALLVGMVGLITRAEGKPPAEFVAGQVLVAYAGTASAAQIAAAESRAGAHHVTTIPGLDVRVLQVARGREGAAISSLRANSRVRFAEWNAVGSVADVSTNDPYFSSQRSTSLDQVRAPLGWSVSTGQAEFAVAVVDTGVSSHPDLAGKILAGYDFVNGDTNASDDNGHGTHVAGIIGAATNNAAGIAGLCWGCNILPVKVLNASGSGSYSAIASGITYAADHGARVINLSLGGTSSSATVQSAVDYAVARGAVVVAASGNQGCDCILYPAAFSNVVAVGAVDGASARRTYSNYGSALDLVAPGTNWTTSNAFASGYAAFSGTSSATPVVSALAAILVGRSPSSTSAQIQGHLTSTAADLGAPGKDAETGYGLVDYAAALSAGPAPDPSPSAGPTPTPAPSASAAPSPSVAPVPSATPTPAPTAVPVAIATKTYRGNLNARLTNKSYGLAVGSGAFTATLSGSPGLALSLRQPDGTTLVSGEGTSVTLSLTLGAGNYVLFVAGSGTKASYSVTVTYVKP
jgi:subtilisin family serine protease